MEAQTIGRGGELATLLGLLDDGCGVLLTGPAGVGKSHLLELLGGRLGDDGRAVTPIRAHESSRHVPFGAVAHLLTEDGAPHHALLLSALRRAVIATGNGTRPVVAVDDVDRLDDDTLALVVSLASTDDALVVATCRTEASVDPRLVDVWKDGLLVRRDVGALARGDADALAAALLAGPVSRTLADRLWQVARGNPLYVRELLLAGRASGAIVDVPVAGGTYWDLDGSLAVGDTLTDLVRNRLHDLDDAAADALAVVAVTEPVDVDVLDAAVTGAPLATLERRRLITTADGRDGHVVTVAHPLVGEVVRDGLGHFGRRRVLERVVATGTTRRAPSEALRVATWLLEIGQSPEPELATTAARVALSRFDHATASRLVTAVPPTTESLVLRARARAGLGDVQAATRDLQDAVELAEDDRERTRVVAAMIDVLGVVEGDRTRANEQLADAIAANDDPTTRQELRVRALVVAGLGGRFADALDLGDELAEADVARPVEAHGLMALTLAQSMTGRLAGVDEHLDRATALADDLRLAEPKLREQVGLNRVLALQATGRLQASLDLVDDVLAASDERRHVGPWLFVGAIASMHVGDLARASRRCAESHHLLREGDPLGVRGVAAGLAAALAGMGGRPTRPWADRAAAVGRPDEVRTRCWLALGDAWATTWDGDPDEGAEQARVAGLEALAGEHVVWGAIVLHAAARMGRPAATSEILDDLDAGPLVDLLAAHARAAAARDADRLAAVATTLEDHDAVAVAVDAWTALVRADGPGSARGARATVRALELADRCPGHLPWLARDLAMPLTARQLEVGRLAATGLESRLIADRLELATKTVDNHLQRLYATLELAGRHELGLAFPT